MSGQGAVTESSQEWPDTDACGPGWGHLGNSLIVGDAQIVAFLAKQKVSGQLYGYLLSPEV